MSCFVPEHTCHLSLFHFHITRNLTKTNWIRKFIIHRLEVLRPLWLFDSAKDSAVFPSPPPAIHSISLHPKAGSLMAAIILGHKQVPEDEKETIFPDGLFLWVRTLSSEVLQSSTNVPLSRVRSPPLPEPESTKGMDYPEAKQTDPWNQDQAPCGTWLRRGGGGRGGGGEHIYAKMMFFS